MKYKILTALMSLGIAFGIWVYVVTVISPNSDNTYRNVSVTLQGEAVLEELGLMITTQDIPGVDLLLEGNRSELQKLNSSNISVTLDVSKIDKPGEHSIPINPSNIRFPGDVSYNAITVARRNPDNIILEVKDRDSQPVPVDVRWNGTEAEGFTADRENRKLDFEQIQVSGPVDVVPNIAFARVFVDLTGKSGTITESLPITLCDENGEPVDARLITTNTGVVQMTLQILPNKQVPLKLNVVSGGGATEQNSIIEMETDTIEVFASDDTLQKLDSVTLGTIRLGEVLDGEVLKFPVILQEGVGNAKDVKEVSVKVRFPDLEVKKLQIDRITAVNVPEGKKAEFTTKTLAITVRGPKKAIKSLKAEHVTVTVDFAGIPDGAAELRATVKLHADFSQVGAVGVYPVSATLK